MQIHLNIQGRKYPLCTISKPTDNLQSFHFSTVSRSVLGPFQNTNFKMMNFSIRLFPFQGYFSEVILEIVLITIGQIIVNSNQRIGPVHPIVCLNRQSELEGSFFKLCFTK